MDVKEKLERILDHMDSTTQEKLRAAELLLQAEAAERQQAFWESQNTPPCADCPPKVGDIVLYNHPGDKTGKYPPKQSPAMILQLHRSDPSDPITADVRVFTAPTYDEFGNLISGGGQIENFKLFEGEAGVPFTWTRR